MVSLDRLNSLFATSMEVQGCKQLIVQDWTCSAKLRQAWNCFLQHVMLWSFMRNAPTTRPRFGFRQRWKLLLWHCPQMLGRRSQVVWNLNGPGYLLYHCPASNLWPARAKRSATLLDAPASKTIWNVQMPVAAILLTVVVIHQIEHYFCQIHIAYTSNFC